MTSSAKKRRPVPGVPVRGDGSSLNTRIFILQYSTFTQERRRAVQQHDVLRSLSPDTAAVVLRKSQQRVRRTLDR
jgi:hypothetical protein